MRDYASGAISELTHVQVSDFRRDGREGSGFAEPQLAGQLIESNVVIAAVG